MDAEALLATLNNMKGSGSPIKRPLSREKSILFARNKCFLAEANVDSATNLGRSDSTFAVVSLGYRVSDIFTAPVTHQD